MTMNRRKILIADCDEHVLINLERLLEDAGYDTTTAWNAKEFRQLVNSRVFDLVLVNEYLPDAECEDLLQTMQEVNRLAHCIVLKPKVRSCHDFSDLDYSGTRDIVCKYAYPQIVDMVQQRLNGGGTELAVA